MADIMLALGPYRFALSTAAYQELERTEKWRWPSQDLIGDWPARQFVGPGDYTHKLQGVILPHYRALLHPRNLASRLQMSTTSSGTSSATKCHVAESAPGRWQLDALRLDADRGIPMLMVDGRGRDWGYWCVESLTENESFFLDNGAALHVDFDLELSYYGDKPPEQNSSQSALIGAITGILGLLA